MAKHDLSTTVLDIEDGESQSNSDMCCASGD